MVKKIVARTQNDGWKPKKKRKPMTEEQRKAAAERLAIARSKKTPSENTSVHPKVLALPDEDNYSFKNVKEWIKEAKDQVSAFSKIARSLKTPPLEKQKAANSADNKKAYIRYCEHYLKHGDWISPKSGAHEEHIVIPKCVAMAYNPDGTPKRTVGVFYSDIHAVWTKEQDGQCHQVS